MKSLPDQQTYWVQVERCGFHCCALGWRDSCPPRPSSWPLPAPSSCRPSHVSSSMSSTLSPAGVNTEQCEPERLGEQQHTTSSTWFKKVSLPSQRQPCWFCSWVCSLYIPRPLLTSLYIQVYNSLKLLSGWMESLSGLFFLAKQVSRVTVFVGMCMHTSWQC